MKVFNHSALLMEPATQRVCPRCKGFGGVNRDDGPCPLCKGHGRLWISASGWTRPLHSRATASQLY